MTDDYVIEPNVRPALVDELDSIAADRARTLDRPVVVCGFTNAERLQVIETAWNEDDELVVVRRRVIRNPRDAVARKIERTIERVLNKARRRTASGE